MDNILIKEAYINIIIIIIYLINCKNSMNYIKYAISTINFV